jgi:hypothetical protein
MKSRNVRLNLTKIARTICADKKDKPSELQRRLVGIPEKIEQDADYLARVTKLVERDRLAMVDRDFRTKYAWWL